MSLPTFIVILGRVSAILIHVAAYVSYCFSPFCGRLESGLLLGHDVTFVLMWLAISRSTQVESVCPASAASRP
jgi:hypothetical protein